MTYADITCAVSTRPTSARKFVYPCPAVDSSSHSGAELGVGPCSLSLRLYLKAYYSSILVYLSCPLSHLQTGCFVSLQDVFPRLLLYAHLPLRVYCEMFVIREAQPNSHEDEFRAKDTVACSKKEYHMPRLQDFRSLCLAQQD